MRQIYFDKPGMNKAMTRNNSDDGVFHVMCRVSGGCTGTREAPLKENGVIKIFYKRSIAEAEADSLNKTMNNAHSLASFSYWVEEQ